MRSLVAVDDAEGDDDSHAAESDERQDEPAVLEAPSDDTGQEQRCIATGAAGRLLDLTAVRRPGYRRSLGLLRRPRPGHVQPNSHNVCRHYWPAYIV